MTRVESERSDVSTIDLFGRTKQDALLHMGPRALVLWGFALAFVDELLPSIDAVEQISPLRENLGAGLGSTSL